MGIIARTFTRGFRTSFFRNQPVHQFYGHLQAVLREIAPGGELDNLFARPEYSADGQALPGEIEWSTPLEGEKVMFKDLTSERQHAVADQIGQAFERIRKYAEDKQSRSGKEKDYAEYLKSVAVSPDLNQIFMVKNQPVLVHWGFVCEDGSHPGQGIYAGWDDFIAEIHRKAGKPVEEKQQRIVLPPEPPIEASEPSQAKEKEPVKQAATVATAASAAPAATVAPEKPSEPKVVKKEEAEEEDKPKRIVACGLGKYQWVKWLAIILAIIILLLLLLRFIPSPQSGFPGMPPGISAGGGGGGLGDLLDQLGGGGGGLPGLGGANGGGKGGQGGPAPAPGSICPTCGHKAADGPAHAPQSQGAGQPGSEHSHDQSKAEPAVAPAGQPAAEEAKPGDN
jgi:hypothetical protein